MKASLRLVAVLAVFLCTWMSVVSQAEQPWPLPPIDEGPYEEFGWMLRYDGFHDRTDVNRDPWYETVYDWDSSIVAVVEYTGTYGGGITAQLVSSVPNCTLYLGSPQSSFDEVNAWIPPSYYWYIGLPVSYAQTKTWSCGGFVRRQTSPTYSEDFYLTSAIESGFQGKRYKFTVVDTADE